MKHRGFCLDRLIVGIVGLIGVGSIVGACVLGYLQVKELPVQLLAIASACIGGLFALAQGKKSDAPQVQAGPQGTVNVGGGEAGE